MAINFCWNFLFFRITHYHLLPHTSSCDESIKKYCDSQIRHPSRVRVLKFLLTIFSEQRSRRRRLTESITSTNREGGTARQRVVTSQAHLDTLALLSNSFCNLSSCVSVRMLPVAKRRWNWWYKAWRSCFPSLFPNAVPVIGDLQRLNNFSRNGMYTVIRFPRGRWRHAFSSTSDKWRAFSDIIVLDTPTAFCQWLLRYLPTPTPFLLPLLRPRRYTLPWQHLSLLINIILHLYNLSC